MRIFPTRARCRRLAILLSPVAVLFGFYLWRTTWWPGVTVQTRHYAIRSSATPAQAEDAGRALEELYQAYQEFFSDLPGPVEPDARLKVDLYRDRREFRRYNPRVGWAEAFYREGRCYAYCGTWEANPYHWLLHEATHQLNHEVARLHVPKWIDEGLATFFSASRYLDGDLLVGRPNRDAYPVWWLYDLDLSGDVEPDVRSGRIIPLSAIITGRGGPDMDTQFNLYYIHWWSLTHFLLAGEDGRRRDAYVRVIRDGGSLDVFEEHLGVVEEIQGQWYEHLLELHRRAIDGEFEP